MELAPAETVFLGGFIVSVNDAWLKTDVLEVFRKVDVLNSRAVVTVEGG